MTFCGFCGKQATEIDELCRNCGSKINEFTIQKIEEVIKMEYHKNIHTGKNNQKTFQLGLKKQ